MFESINPCKAYAGNMLNEYANDEKDVLSFRCERIQNLHLCFILHLCFSKSFVDLNVKTIGICAAAEIHSGEDPLFRRDGKA